MKPTKMRNHMIYQATFQTKSKQLGGNLSKDLQKKYGKRSVRVVEGDSVTIFRGEFKGVTGKVSKISTQKSSVAIEGIKREKSKGDKFDIYIHTSNLAVTSLNTEDKWRIAKLEGQDPRKQIKIVAESMIAEQMYPLPDDQERKIDRPNILTRIFRRLTGRDSREQPKTDRPNILTRIFRRLTGRDSRKESKTEQQQQQQQQQQQPTSDVVPKETKIEYDETQKQGEDNEK